MSSHNKDKKIAQLETELEEMTVALAHAWDQLVPFLEDTTPSKSVYQHITSILDALLIALDTAVAITFLNQSKQWFQVPESKTIAPNITDVIKQQNIFKPVYLNSSSHYFWVLVPIIVEKNNVGIIGIGRETGEYSAVDVRIIERMADRLSSHMIADQLALSREYELQTRQEFKIASTIQESIQPNTMPSLTHLDMATYWQPARQVGGDAWGWVQQDQHRLSYFLLDVAGKGLPAALAAVSLHTAIKIGLRTGMSPVEVMQMVNHEVYDAYTKNDLLATVVIITIDIISNTLEQANAGHLPTIIRQGKRWHHLEASVPPIGIFEDMVPERQIIQLSPDDVIICCSDGFTEIETPDGLWGDKGLMNAIGSQNISAKAVVESIIQSAKAVEMTSELHDDQTLVVVKYF